MTHCAHCGRGKPYDAAADDKNRRKGWSVHDVTLVSGRVVTVAVCGKCRLTRTGRADEHHEPGTCPGNYQGADAFAAECKDYDCHERWSCWIEACVKGWQDDHWQDGCCSNCDGHHETVMKVRPLVRRDVAA
jgi:hypothetical protein